MFTVRVTCPLRIAPANIERVRSVGVYVAFDKTVRNDIKVGVKFLINV